jgi:transcriptional regulator with XRE-family HTH domain
MIHLERERRARGWSKAELARRANLNAATVGAIENRRLRPYACQLEKLAGALGWPKAKAEQLLGEAA